MNLTEFTTLNSYFSKSIINNTTVNTILKMKRFFTVLFTATSLITQSSVHAQNNNIQSSWTNYVKPNVGTTHSRWFFYTPAAVPFGMAKLSPSTNGSYGNPTGWEAVGYEDGHTSIEGFPCFHEFQVGGIMLMPTTGNIKTQPGKLDSVHNGYRSAFDKSTEVATPGYYAVFLKDYSIKAELTATKRVGFQRYTFPKSDASHIIFDIGNKLGESGEAKDAYIRLVDAQTMEGFVITRPEYVKKYQSDGDVRMYFHATLSKPVAESKVFYRGGTLADGKEIKGAGSAMALGFSTLDKEQVVVKIGLSYTSIDNAKTNLNAEARSLTFDEAKETAQNTWNEELGKIKVYGKNENDKIKFYTGLFHAILGRGLASDVNGAYPKNDGGVGQIDLNSQGKPKHNHYNTDAIWGAFWNLTQLWALAYPEYYADWVSSQLLVYKDAGWLGDGIANSRYVSGVGTNFTGLAIAAAYNCGIRNFNVPLAYEAVLKNEIDGKDRPLGAGKPDVAFFVEKGFAPYSPERQKETVPEGWMFGTSHTLEYSFSCYAAAQFAKQLGKTKDYNLLTKLSGSWKNIFDKETQLMRPRLTDGSFIKKFDRMAPWIGFQEGNAVQYTFYVPHQPEQLAQLIGLKTFNNRLDSIFLISQKDIFGGGKTVNAFAGIQAVYNHGNQPNLHISWLFNFSGRPSLSQKWVRAICNEFYGTDGVHGYGYGQDEDQGQLGAWYVMSSVGLFDVKGLTGAHPSFQIGNPLFDKVEIKLNPNYYKGKNFVIETTNNSTENQYIQQINVNGKKQSSVFLPFETVKRGGLLNIKLGNTPKDKL